MLELFVSFMGMSQSEALLLTDMDHLSMEAPFSLTEHPVEVEEGRLIRTCFSPGIHLISGYWIFL